MVNPGNSKMFCSRDRDRFQCVSMITSSNSIGKLRFAQMTLGQRNKRNYKCQSSSAPREYVIQKNGSYEKVTKIEPAAVTREYAGLSHEQKMTKSNINACFQRVQKPSIQYLHDKCSLMNAEVTQPYENMSSTQRNANSNRNEISHTTSISPISSGCYGPVSEEDGIDNPSFLQENTAPISPRSNESYGSTSEEGSAEIPWFLQDYTASSGLRSDEYYGPTSEEDGVEIPWFLQDYTASSGLRSNEFYGPASEEGSVEIPLVPQNCTASNILRSNECYGPANEEDGVEIPLFLQDYTASSGLRSNEYYGPTSEEDGIEIPWFLQDYTASSGLRSNEFYGPASEEGSVEIPLVPQNCTASNILRSNECYGPAKEEDGVEIPWFLQDYTASSGLRSDEYYGPTSEEDGVEIPWFLQDYTASIGLRSNEYYGPTSEEDGIEIPWFLQDYTASSGLRSNEFYGPTSEEGSVEIPLVPQNCTASNILRSNECYGPANEEDGVEIPWFLQDYTASSGLRSNEFYGPTSEEDGVEIPWFLQDYTASSCLRSNECYGPASDEGSVEISWFTQNCTASNILRCYGPASEGDRVETPLFLQDYTISNPSPQRAPLSFPEHSTCFQSGLKSFLVDDCIHRSCIGELTGANAFQTSQNRSSIISERIPGESANYTNDDWVYCVNLELETGSSSDNYPSSWFDGDSRGHLDSVPGTPQHIQSQPSASGGFTSHSVTGITQHTQSQPTASGGSSHIGPRAPQHTQSQPSVLCSTTSDESYQTAIGECINDDWTCWSDVNDPSSWSDGHNYSVPGLSKNTHSSPFPCDSSSNSTESYQTAVEEYVSDNPTSWTDVEYRMESRSLYRESVPVTALVTQPPPEIYSRQLLSESWEYCNDDGVCRTDVRLRADCDPSIWFHPRNHECRYSSPKEPQVIQLQSEIRPSYSNPAFKTTTDKRTSELISHSADTPIQSLSRIFVPELVPGDVVFERDTEGERIYLGKGAFGRVYLATLKGEQNQVVVKEFTERLTVLEKILHETRILLLLEKTNAVPKCLGIMPTPYGPSRAAMVQECIGGGMTLQRLLNTNPPLVDQAGWLDICYQLARGLDAIHEQQVLVNDIKYDNILIDCESPCARAKFIDMGYASFRKPHIFMASEQTLERYFYLAPEIRQGEATSIKSDIYSLGYVYDHVVREAGLSRLTAVSKKCQRKRPKERPSTKTLINMISDILF
ncbi:hypothetical protein ScPMuIL_010115 [Solemya velum]